MISICRRRPERGHRRTGRGVRPVVLGVLVAVLATLASLLGGPAYADQAAGPKLTAVTALSAHRLLATFDQAPTAAALNPASYVITGPAGAALAISAVSLTGTNQALMSTATQSVVAYSIRGPAANATSVTFTGSVDREPTLLGARSTGARTVDLTFSEPMGTDAADTARYPIVDSSSPPKPLSVTAATVDPANPSRVTLKTAAQVAVNYKLTLGDLRGRSGKYNDPTARTATFLGAQAVNTGAPRLLSAKANGPTGVVLTFDKQLAASAGDQSLYSASPALFITKATLRPGLQEVALVTGTQYAVPYRITANVTSAAGTPIAPQRQVRGVPGHDPDQQRQAAVDQRRLHRQHHRGGAVQQTHGRQHHRSDSLRHRARRRRRGCGARHQGPVPWPGSPGGGADHAVAECPRLPPHGEQRNRPAQQPPRHQGRGNRWGDRSDQRHLPRHAALRRRAHRLRPRRAHRQR